MSTVTTPTAESAPTLWDRVSAVNQLLFAGEPGNHSSADKQGHFGYQPQAIVDALNQVFGVGGWGCQEISSDVIDGKSGNSTLCAAKVRFWIADCAFQPEAWGEGQQAGQSVGDVRKAAFTDALKKAAALLSIGNRAYLGELTAEEQSASQQRPLQQRQQRQAAPQPQQNRPAAQYAAAPVQTEEQQFKAQDVRLKNIIESHDVRLQDVLDGLAAQYGIWEVLTVSAREEILGKLVKAPASWWAKLQPETAGAL